MHQIWRPAKNHHQFIVRAGVELWSTHWNGSYSPYSSFRHFIAHTHHGDNAFLIDRFHKDVLNGVAPYFVFGDFNFRCDTEGVVKVWIFQFSLVTQQIIIIFFYFAGTLRYVLFLKLVFLFTETSRRLNNSQNIKC